MTRLDALRVLRAKPREVPDDGKIGRRVIHEKADGREKLSMVVKVLNFTKRKAS